MKRYLEDKHKDQRNLVLEVGGGYGGLAHHLSNILKNVTYVIVDLPETLLFSAAYISLQNPDKKIYLYDSADFSEFINGGQAGSYDFVLIPNYRLPSLNDWEFKLVINMISFQEMSAPQVNDYLQRALDPTKSPSYGVPGDE